MTGSLGFLLATVPFATLILLLGWRITFFSTGLLLCLCGVLLYFVLVQNTKRIFSKEPVFKTEEIQREKAPDYYEEYFQAGKHGLYFLSFWRCWRVCWLY